MNKELPANANEAKEMGKDYPHTKEELTKKILWSRKQAKSHRANHPCLYP